MDPLYVLWIDEPGYWHKRLPLGNDREHCLDLLVGARVKKDGTIKFKATVEPSATIPDASAALQLAQEHDSLNSAKHVCD
jgi:hypothetical protein